MVKPYAPTVASRDTRLSWDLAALFARIAVIVFARVHFQ